ncbi:hypothetical protein IFO70_38760 [Phormidium tenue FACHB-886]|nr:hypothetical protein [Phormidium tenue FACHB-886]
MYRAVDSEGNTLDFMLSALARWQSSGKIFSQSTQGSAHSDSTSD